MQMAGPADRLLRGGPGRGRHASVRAGRDPSGQLATVGPFLLQHPFGSFRAGTLGVGERLLAPELRVAGFLQRISFAGGAVADPLDFLAWRASASA